LASSLCYIIGMAKIDDLISQLQKLSKFGSALALLGWDEEVNLPAAAYAFRGEVNATLSSELHRMFTSDELYKLVCDLNTTDEQSKLDDDQKVIVREVKRDIEHARKLPTEFVEKMSVLTSQAFSAWVEARKQSNFKLYEPVLLQIVELKKQEAEYLGYKDSPYDALLDEYEEGMNTAKIDALFGPLVSKLSTLISSIDGGDNMALPPSSYPIEKQKLLNQEVAAALGYKLDAGRIDISPHPFTIGLHPSDVRITTRYDEHDFWGALGSTIHETGHALYEQGLPASQYGTPLGEAVSLGVHESQSRTWENFVGRSRGFAAFLFPLLKKYFGELNFDEDQLFLSLNRVKPNPIRVESDEVTYNLHIVLRYELEKELIEGRMKVSDLPEAWNAKVKQYLGLDINNDAEGVLQDVHWSHGSFGYFPTYTLGNIYAAQLFNTAEKDIQGLSDGFAKGNFAPLLEWLRTNIHSAARRYAPDELIQKATKEAPTSKYLLEHLTQKTELNS